LYRFFYPPPSEKKDKRGDRLILFLGLDRLLRFFLTAQLIASLQQGYRERLVGPHRLQEMAFFSYPLARYISDKASSLLSTHREACVKSGLDPFIRATPFY
jgi:hypothetical protein